MSLADKLACATDRRDEAPNIELAAALAKQEELNSEILELLSIVKNGYKPQRHDAIKVLYELAALRPNEMSDKFTLFIDMLAEKDNRVLWGLLTLIAETATAHPDLVPPHLDNILAAADRGSVIAKDRAIEILALLLRHQIETERVLPLIFDQLEKAAINQLPNYAEQMAPLLPKLEAAKFMALLETRLDEASPAKRKRLEKAITIAQN